MKLPFFGGMALGAFLGGLVGVAMQEPSDVARGDRLYQEKKALLAWQKEAKRQIEDLEALNAALFAENDEILAKYQREIGVNFTLKDQAKAEHDSLRDQIKAKDEKLISVMADRNREAARATQFSEAYASSQQEVSKLRTRLISLAQKPVAPAPTPRTVYVPVPSEPIYVPASPTPDYSDQLEQIRIDMQKARNDALQMEDQRRRDEYYWQNYGH